MLRQGYITLGYRGTFAIGRGDMSTTGFRKLTRLLVCGKSALCREVFKVRAGTAALQRVDQSLMQDTLNESRDPDRGLDGDRLVHGCQNIIIEIELCHSLMT